MFKRSLTFAVAVIMVSSFASAQDFMDYNAVNVTSSLQVMMQESVAHRSMVWSQGRPSSRIEAPPPRAASTSGAGYVAQPAGPSAGAVAFPYRSTAELRRSAADGLIERTTKTDPAVGKLLASEMAKNDFNGVYASIVRPFGYRVDDAADALAAYTLLGWLIANGAPDPTRVEAAAVRSQIAAGLANDPRLADPRTRAELAEELKLLFVIMHAGWQSARLQGDLKQYGNGVTAMFRRFSGNDLRTTRLTADGFLQQ